LTGALASSAVTDESGFALPASTVSGSLPPHPEPSAAIAVTAVTATTFLQFAPIEDI
jgi:hypothetical protein